CLVFTKFQKGQSRVLLFYQEMQLLRPYVIADTLAMTLSSFSVLMHLYLLTTKTKRKGISKTFDSMVVITMWALFAMIVAFITGTYAVLGHCPGLATAACVLLPAFYFFS
ncbi:unnamed protein product, partial [Prunus brigantina]